MHVAPGHTNRSTTAEQKAVEPASDDVSAQVDRILASPGFAQSARLQRFLRFIVAETLAGCGDRLKEYAIARDVFGRDETFDPQLSSIVRVEASRLRGKLKEYYAEEGRDDPVRIDLPPGSYVPRFRASRTDARARERTDDGARSSALLGRPLARAVVLLAAGLALAALTALVLLELPRSRPVTDGGPATANSIPSVSIAVLPLRNLSGDPEQDFLPPRRRKWKSAIGCEALTTTMA